MKLKKTLALLLIATLTISSNITGVTTNAEQSQAKQVIAKSEQNSIKQSTVKKLEVFNETQLLAKKSKYTTISKAAEAIRPKVLRHEPNARVYIKTTISNPTDAYTALRNEVLKITDNSDEGDYMRWDNRIEEPSYRYYSETKSGKKYYYYEFKIKYTYYTTLTQKNQVDQKVDEIIKSFNFTETTTDYEKVKTVYDYVCSTVTYAKDMRPLIVYTSWSALFNNEAVCQGYAQLMYKMLKELGISVRVIPGKANNQSHGWNIVKLGDYYYNLDSTWDAELYHNKMQYQFFLKGDKFPYHKRYDEFSTDEFYAEYPMAEKEYGQENQDYSFNSKKAKFQIIEPKIISAKRKKIKIRKIDEVKKYEVLYCTSKKFRSNKKKMVTSKTVFKLKRLKKEKKYYVKYRGYCYIDGTRVNTRWSSIKRIKKFL